ncbi:MULTISPECIES: hypothetical protein [unclassified Streptomyces]|uniref:hypothetical protein n=1 Tax=unclassified Streptomyces TaxID=2593676 RepID=UPI0033A5A242
MAINKTLVSAAVCAAVALALTGCSKSDGGSSDKAGKAAPSASPSPAKPVDPFAGMTADQIADKSLDVTKAVDSLKAKVTDTVEKVPETFEVVVSKTGECDGTLTSEGASVQFRHAAKAYYLKGDEKYWRQGEEDSPKEEVDAMVEILKGRWVEMPQADAEAEGMAEMCDSDGLLDVGDDVTGLTRGADTTVDGQPAAVLTKKDGAETTTLYVAAKGEPYLLKYTVVGGEAPASGDFRDFGKPVTVTAPPADQIVDLEKLGG